MMKTKQFFLILFTLTSVVLAGCNSDRVVSPLYKGKHLSIGVIGKSPNVREKNITFTKINFHELSNPDELSRNFDAIFITKKNLQQASQSQYVKSYKQLTIPTFFIQSEKSYIPFVMEDLSYTDAPNVYNQTYATGILQNQEGLKSWGYGLYNDTINHTNIKDAYTRIFNTIEEVE